jgi:hypothetical protein
LQEPPKFTRIWIFGLKIKYLATLNSGAGERERGQKANLSENENEFKKKKIGFLVKIGVMQTNLRRAITTTFQLNSSLGQKIEKTFFFVRKKIPA